MRIGPHLAFVAHLEGDADHPRGFPLAEPLAQALRDVFGEVGAPDNWRDVGWVVELRVGREQVQVYFARYDEAGTWLLAVAPAQEPGLVGWLLGRKPSATPGALKEVCSVVHAHFTASEGVSQLRWMLGGPPGKVRAFDKPEDLLWHEAL